MTESELITGVAESMGVAKASVREVLKYAGDYMAAALRAGEEVPLPGLGKLKPTTRAGRMGRNPKTGEPLEIPAKHSAKFVPAKALRDALAA